MSLISYQLDPGVSGGTINQGDGVSFDVGAAVAAGGGTLTVDDQVFPRLVAALDAASTIVHRTSITPETPPIAETAGPLIIMSPGDVGDIPVRQNDGTFEGVQSLPVSAMPTVVFISGSNGPPAWVGSHFYPANYVVVSGGIVYINTVAHTSASTWGADASNWLAFGTSGSSNLLVPTGLKSSGVYTAAGGDLVQVDLSTSSVQINLPHGLADKSQIGWKIVKYASPNVLTVQLSGGDAFDVAGGSTSQTGQQLNQTKLYQYQSGTSLWTAIGGDLALSQLDARFVPQIATDAQIPKQARVSDTDIDLNRAWSDGVTSYAAASPGDDITLRMQAAINFLGGATGLFTGPAVTAIGIPGGNGGEIYWSKSGNYVIGTTMQSGTSGGNAYQGVILFPGIIYSQGVSIRIRGTHKPVWSSETNQPGVKLTSACAGGEMFSAPAAGSGSYPALSQICPQFDRITFVNTADGGALDMYSGGAYNAIDCLAISTLAKGAGTRRAYTSPHNIQHGDMIIRPLWVRGGYKTALGVSEHLVAEGWHAVSGVQNVIETYGAGAAIRIAGNLWHTNCDTLIWPSTSTCRILIDSAVWEVGGNASSRLINDTSAAVSGKVSIHLASANLVPKASLCGTAWGSGTNSGSELDVEALHNDPGGWHVKHPKETFRRVIDPIAVSDVPGYSSDTWHPWFMPAGAFTFASVRAGCGVTNGSATVTDPNITAADQGRTVQVAGGGFGSGCFVGTVTPGVSYLVSSDPILQHNLTYTGTTNASISVTLGVASGSQPGQLFNNAPGVTTVTGGMPVKSGLYGGESRSATAIFNLASNYTIQMFMNRVLGTNGSAANGNQILLSLNAGRITVSVSGSGTLFQSPAGSLVAGNSYQVIGKLEIGADGLVKRITGEYALVGGTPTKFGEHLFTSTERNAIGPGSNQPHLLDGITISSADTGGLQGSSSSGLMVRPYASSDIARRGAIVAYTAAAGVLTPTPIDAGGGHLHQVQANDTAAILMPKPTDIPDATMTQDLTFEFFNNSGGAMGAVTWDATGTTNRYLMLGNTLTTPASTKRRQISFKSNGNDWIYQGQTVDY